MQIKKFLPLVLVAVVSAQDSPPSLSDALSSTEELSQLAEVLSGFEELSQMLSEMENITILAPSNDAFEEFSSGPMGDALNDPALVQAVLSYHVLKGTYLAEDVTDTPAFIPTLLTNESYVNVTGGQVVKALANDDDVVFYSGLLTNSTVTEADVEFENGVIHIIDRLLTIPALVSRTILDLERSSLVGAIILADQVDIINTIPDVTIFAPSNEAFQAIGGNLANASEEELTTTLGYHVIEGTIGYSSALENGTTLETRAGESVTITIEDDEIFVNSAKVVIADVLVANGVVHGIDNVLNPANSTASPDPSATSQEPAFSDASSVSEVPFTSGNPTPTTTIVATETETVSGGGDAEATSSEEDAAPMVTGAIGMAALFGGAAAAYNM